MSDAQKPVAWKLQFLTDVTTAAGLLEHGKQCKALAKRIGEGAFRMRKELHDRPAAENAELLAALAETQTLLAAMMHEVRHYEEIQQQMLSNRVVIARAEGVQRDN